MKLILCTNCQDVIRLIQEEERKCICGKSTGKYIDELNAIYSGKFAIPLGFHNISLAEAVKNQPQQGMGKEFIAFVIPEENNTFKKL